MSGLEQSYAVLLPEFVVAGGGILLLLFGVFRGDRSQSVVSNLSILLFVIAAYFVVVGADGTAFNGAFIADGFSRFVNVLALLGAAATLLMAQAYLETERLMRFEYPVLIVLATLGMMLMVSANSFIALYMGLELHSLALYVLAAFKRDSIRSTEAGLKYFVLGALSSGMLLYGISLVYGFTGTVSFAGVAAVVGKTGVNIGLIFGLVFLIAGLVFKIAAVPFHMWTPDVYEGSPTPVTAFFITAPKVAAMALILRAIIVPFPDALHQWQQVVQVIAALSMALGAVAAIGQANIKRLMAYSSIGHMGYALLGLAAGTPQGIASVLVYMTIYLVTNAGVFACILAMKREGEYVETISDLAGLARTQPKFAFAMAAFMFSLAGIPPLAGFLAKFYVFMAAINAHLYALALLGVIASVVGAFYYLRIVKIMYMDAPAPAFERDFGGRIGTVMAGAGAFTLFFVVFAAPIVAAAGTAAQALFK